MKGKIFIVEDELLIIEDLSNVLEGAGYSIAGYARDGDAALKKIRESKPDLVLLDIKLKGTVTGLDVAKEINDRIPFFFITSSKDRESVDEILSLNTSGYILKPFVEEELLINVQLALSKKPKQLSKTPSKLMIREGTVLKKVDAFSIAFAKGEDNYTKINLTDGGEHLISHTLKSIEEKLIEFKSFCRVHKSYVVNLDHLKGIEGQNLIVNDQIIPIGNSYRSRLFERFEVL